MSNESGIDHEFVDSIKKTIEQNLKAPLESPMAILAALHIEFNFESLKSEIKALFGIYPTEEEEVYVRDNSFFIEIRNCFTLDDHTRHNILKQTGFIRIRELINLIKPDSTTTQSLFSDYINGKEINLERMEMDQLIAALDIAKWLDNTGITHHEAAYIIKFIKKKEQLTHFNKLVANFKGRQDELQLIRNYLRLENTPNSTVGSFFSHSDKSSKTNLVPAYFIKGVGGVGKSTLIANAVLDQLTAYAPIQIPFVYIDLDRPGLYSVRKILSIVKESLLQLSIQFENLAEEFKKIISIIEQDYVIRSFGADSTSSDRQILYESVFNRDAQSFFADIKTPVIFILDSFEELQYRASNSEIENLFDFLYEIRIYIPQLRLFFVGRSEIEYPSYDFIERKLTGFDKPSASGFLNTLGISEIALQEYIYEKLGKDPLTLQLAANFLTKTIIDGPITLQRVLIAKLFTDLKENLIQEELVSRNLDHLHSKNRKLRDIAIPGILVRRVNADIIRNILVEGCGLGDASQDESEILFNELSKETFLFNYDGPNLIFRQDLRLKMLPLIGNKPPAKKIHDAAIKYYSGRHTVEDRAEYLYHLFMRGDNPYLYDKEYTDQVKPYIDVALIEMPDRAFVYLANKMGIGVPKEKLVKIELPEWENFVTNLIIQAFNSKEVKQLVNVKNILEGRKERTGTLDFGRYEMALYFALSEFDAARVIAYNVLDKQYGFPKNQLSQDASILAAVLQIVHSYETELFFEKAWDLLEKISNCLILPNTSEYRKEMVDFYITLARLKERLKNGSFIVLSKSVDGSITNYIKVLMNEEEDLPSLLPLPYSAIRYPAPHTAASSYSGGGDDDDDNDDDDDDADLFLSSLLTGHDVFMSATEFADSLNELQLKLPTKADLERHLLRNYSVNLKDIVVPGNFSKNLIDTLLFIEVHPSRDKAQDVYISSKYNSKINEATVAAYSNNNEVLRCLETLRHTYNNIGINKLIVSDIIDAQGYQYVNLLQGGPGTSGFVMAGYTYILEQMGIRFNHIVGEGAGAINSAMLTVIDDKQSMKSEKMLDYFSNVDFFSFVDGAPMNRWLIKQLIANTFRSTRSRLTSMLVTPILLFATCIVLNTLFTFLKYPAAFIYILNVITVVCFIGYSLAIVYFRNFLKNLDKTKGLNPGVVFTNWIEKILIENSIHTISDLYKKASAPIRGVRNREYSERVVPNSGNVDFIISELATQSKIFFPRMAGIFATQNKLDSLRVADFIRASAALPIFFEPLVINNLATSDAAIRSAWKKQLQIEDPPEKVFLVMGISRFPMSLFYDDLTKHCEMPVFGIVTNDIDNKKNYYDVEKYGLFEYILRSLQIEMRQKDYFPSKYKALKMGFTAVSLHDHNVYNYFIDDQAKIELFVKGTQAATEFLKEFKWEKYKENMRNIEL